MSRFSVVVLFILLLIVPSLRAQPDSSWTALIYEANSGTLTEIDPQGEVLREINLPSEPGMSVHGLRAAASPDGTFVAYTLADNANGNVTRVQLNVYDLLTDRVVGVYALPEGVNVNSFNQFSLNLTTRIGGGAVASGFGYFVEDILHWEIVTIATDTGAVTVLTSSAAETLGVEPVAYGYPIVLNYEGNVIRFAVAPLEGMNQYRFLSYTWNTAENTIEPQGETTIPEDTAPSGARVRLDYDGSLPFARETPHFGFIDPYNVVMLAESGGGERLLYHNGERMIIRAYFAENGQKVIITKANPIGTFRKEIINLQGNVLHAEDDLNIIPPTSGTPDGYLELITPGNSAPTLTHTRTVDGSLTATPIWKGEVGGWYEITVIQ